jgi:hypothetical protein
MRRVLVTALGLLALVRAQPAQTSMPQPASGQQALVLGDLTWLEAERVLTRDAVTVDRPARLNYGSNSTRSSGWNTSAHAYPHRRSGKPLSGSARRFAYKVRSVRLPANRQGVLASGEWKAPPTGGEKRVRRGEGRSHTVQVDHPRQRPANRQGEFPSILVVQDRLKGLDRSQGVAFIVDN